MVKGELMVFDTNEDSKPQNVIMSSCAAAIKYIGPYSKIGAVTNSSYDVAEYFHAHLVKWLSVYCIGDK